MYVTPWAAQKAKLCSCTSEGNHGRKRTSLVLVHTEGTPRAGHLWGLPPEPGSQPCVCRVAAGRAEKRQG